MDEMIAKMWSRAVPANNDKPADPYAINIILGILDRQARLLNYQALCTALGVNIQYEFEAFLKAKKEAADAQKTELQRLTKAAQKATERVDKLEAESKAKLEATNKWIVDGEIKLLAT